MPPKIPENRFAYGHGRARTIDQVKQVIRALQQEDPNFFHNGSDWYATEELGDEQVQLRGCDAFKADSKDIEYIRPGGPIKLREFLGEKGHIQWCQAAGNERIPHAKRLSKWQSTRDSTDLHFVSLDNLQF